METVSCQWDSHPLLWRFCGWESDKSNFERKASHRENPDDDDAPVGHTPDDCRDTKNLSEQSQVGVHSKPAFLAKVSRTGCTIFFFSAPFFFQKKNPEREKKKIETERE